MSNNITEFNRDGINAVNIQASLMPTVVYADWKTRGVAGGVDGIALIKETIINFFLNPTKDDNFNVILGIYARYQLNGGLVIGSFAYTARMALLRAINEITPEIAKLIDPAVNDKNTSIVGISRHPSDPRFDVFSYRGR